jgi:hypothetical protein
MMKTAQVRGHVVTACYCERTKTVWVDLQFLKAVGYVDDVEALIDSGNYDAVYPDYGEPSIPMLKVGVFDSVSDSRLDGVLGLLN